MDEVEVFEHDAVPASVTWQAVTLMRCAWPGLFVGPLRWIERPFEADERPVHVVVSRGRGDGGRPVRPGRRRPARGCGQRAVDALALTS